MKGGTSPKVADLPYRRGVGAVLIGRNGKVFVGRRIGARHPNAWQMPQGGIDEGETPERAVLRELAEETGTGKAEIVAVTGEWLTYDLPEDLAGVSWGGTYRGQKQKWFALRFTGEDADIDLDAHGEPEFSDWKWDDMEELPGLIVPFKRRIYQEIVAEFGYLPARVASGS